MECYKCGLPGSKVRLFDAISSEGIVSICEKCSEEEGLPVIRKPTTFQLKESERKPGSVYERLSRAAGIKRTFSRFDGEAQKRAELKAKQDTTLKDIVDKNFHRKLAETPSKPRLDLIKNFHWIIMRARRSKKISTKQLAEQIAESEVAVKMAEKGVLPEDDYRIVNKLENFLGIRIIKNPPVENAEMTFSVGDDAKKSLSFDPVSTKALTISDLREMKKKRESEIFEKSEEVPTPDPEEFDEDVSMKEESMSLEDKKDLTDEEMDDLIFGRKG